ncbi:SpoVR family protein [Aquisalibacillus elongatus]|uniref:SpoVR like protein n=1 Tax=Aquisalibacillus elongatus TaxID=485577 RepID=A0A3N5AYK8_9BACI|nr:SpoVR family protein [Aquisalibacillus elongatus]RPF50134.1 SpoVR like protein [Aquisalibacillus elongatus]
MEYRIKRVSVSEILDIHYKGYFERYGTSRPKNSDNHVLEVFEIDQPPTIYLNNNHSRVEFHYVMAHCQGHLEFINENGLLKNLRKPRLRKNAIKSLFGYEDLNLFINTMRTLATTTHDLNSHFISPINYFLSKPDCFKNWQLWLLKLINEEALYFNAIKRTKLMNEGYATWRQGAILKELNLSLSEKMELTYLEAKLHVKPDEGLNYYSLGKALWKEVSTEDLNHVLCSQEDHLFIEQYYTEIVHEKENISVVIDGEVFNDYQSVKRYLSHFFKHQQPQLYIDQLVTKETGYLTIRYLHFPQHHQLHINQLKASLEKIFKQPVYFKPFSYNEKIR